MEVEARMNRNYLPPSIQGGYQYQNQSPPSANPAQNTQGSITAGTPNYAKNAMKPVLETIPQGSIMRGSITSGTPISQAVSPFTPSIPQFSPTHGAVASQAGSIISGTPMPGQGSIVSGTPVQNQETMFPFTQISLPNLGSMVSGPSNQSGSQMFQDQSQDSMFSMPMPGQGSILSGMPLANPQTLFSSPSQSSDNSVLPMESQNSVFPGTSMSSQPLIGSGVPNDQMFSNLHMQNHGSITSGTPIQNQSFLQNNPSSMVSSTPNHGSIMYGIPNQGSIMTGISNQGSIMTGISNQGSIMTGISNQGSIATGMSNQGSIMSGISKQGSIMSGISNQGSIMSGISNQGSIMAGIPNQGSIASAITNHGSIVSGISNQGSIMSGTPIPSQGSIMSGTPMTVDKNYGNFPNFNLNFNGSQGQSVPMSIPSGSITAGTPVPNPGFNQSAQYTRQRKYSGPQRVKLQMLATVQEMAREHAERYSPVRRAELSPPRATHDLASARQEYRQLQRGLERRNTSAAVASPPGERAHAPALSLPASPSHVGASSPALDFAALGLDPARDRNAQDLSLKIGINLYSPHLSQEVLKSIHSYGSFGLLSGHTSPASPGSPLHQITEGLSYLHTGSITRGTPQANATPLDLRNNVEMETNYPQLHPMVHPQIHVVAHRSLNNSPISNPSSPLDMIQEEIGNGQAVDKFIDRSFQTYPPTHPQISITDCLGSEITLVASSSEDSVDSLENSKYPLPQFVISEPSELDDRPSITKGIGRKVSQEVEHVEAKETNKDAEMQSPKESVDETSKFLIDDLRARRGSDKSLGFSDDSLSNDSANASPNCEQNIQSIYSNIVSISSGFSENRGSFSEHRESFSFSDRGSISERGDLGRSSFSERSDLGRGSFSERGETPRSSFSAQGVLEEVKEYYEDVYMPRDDLGENQEIEKLQRSTMDLRLTEVCRPEEQKIPILLSPQKVSCVQEYYEVALSTSCSQLDSQRIVELLKETINMRVPPQNIFVETGDQTDKPDDVEALTGFLNLEYSGGIQIELVLCENRLKEKKGLKMRRISGDQQAYGKLCQQLITSLTV